MITVLSVWFSTTSSLPHTSDPLQFAYRQNRSPEDATASALHLSLEHLEGKNTRVRMLLVDLVKCDHFTAFTFKIRLKTVLSD